MNVRQVFALTVALAFVVAVVVYLQWWQGGELGHLTRRVNELDEYRRRREQEGRKPTPRRRSSSSPTKPTEGSTT